MDRADRLGLPLGTATQSSGRGLPENPAQGRRLPLQSSGSNGAAQVPPMPANFAASSGTASTSSAISSVTTASSQQPSLPPPSTGASSLQPPALRTAAASTSSAPLSANQVIALAREAMQEALRHTDQQAGDGNVVSHELKPGITIDLSYKNIQKLPEEVVDIIINKLERLAISHNKLSSFPARFAECSSLRYLNVRNNDIREFPLPLCDLRSLEILDLGRNKLRVLPPDIVKLASLKVFALQKNRIEELPLCLADMASLQVLKLDGNPIRFPPPEVFQVQASTPPNEGYLAESEVTELAITAHLKKFLRQALLNDRAGAVVAAAAAANFGNASASRGSNANGPTSAPSSSNGSVSGAGPSFHGSISGGGFVSDASADDSSDPVKPQRLVPGKRSMSGRFPIKVNGQESSDLRSPGQSRPPPIPTRSHYRGLSQQNTAVRRPSVMPLTISSVNERLRSNSETTLLSARGDGSQRSRRMGIVSRKTQELGTLEEIEVNNRFSHYRGLSHGSAMQGNQTGPAAIAAGAKSPVSPVSDAAMTRPTYVRRLSILPERRRESKYCNPIVEMAKGVLYSIFQIHPTIQMLLSLASDGTKRHSHLEIIFYNTNSHVQQLEREIQNHENAVDAGEWNNVENEGVHRACLTLLHAYDHICLFLKSNVDLFLDNGDPRYVRTLLVQLYHSIMELRVASASTVGSSDYQRPNPNHFLPAIASQASSAASSASSASSVSDGTIDTTADTVSLGDTVKLAAPQLPSTYQDSRSATTTDGAGTVTRGLRAGSVSHPPTNLRVATDVPLPGPGLGLGTVPFINGTGRTATISATPRSGESFISTTSSDTPTADITDEDRMFEKIFLSLQKSTDLALQLLPSLRGQFSTALRAAMVQRAPEQITHDWRMLLGKCATAIQHTETLKSRLSNIKLKEPGVRWQDAYWNLCVNFFNAWYVLVRTIRDLTSTLQQLADTRAQLHPLHHSIKDSARLILRSPWAYALSQSALMVSVTTPLTAGGNAPRALDSRNGGGHTIQMPMTPQSAALGPAVQATVPSTPQSVSFANAFAGNVFERADALISSGGISMSRTGTFSSTPGSSGLNSINSTLSGHTDGSMTPSSILSPGGMFRLNNGSKVAF